VCTVTILPETVLAATAAGAARRLRLRVASNRDELLTRAAALPPSTFRIGTRRAVMPRDPDSGGTWIGANDAGIVCALLNVYDGAPAATADLSRGTIIPPLLGCDGLDSALARARTLPIDRYRPFRLLIVEPGRLIECWPDDGGLGFRVENLREAAMRTSSGLGDGLVAGPRGDLFRSFFSHASDPVAAEDLFHLHQWRGREAISVRMRRPDARTVSHTVVEISEQSVSLVYRPANAPDRVLVTMAA